MKNDSLYNTFVKGQRVSHFSSLVDLSSRPLVKETKRKGKQKVKSRTVSRVDKCRVVCQSVGLAIKTPHTLLTRSPLIFYKNRAPSFSSGLYFLFFFLKMLSPSLEKEEEEIIYNLLQLIQRIQNIKMVSLPGAAPNIGGQY